MKTRAKWLTELHLSWCGTVDGKRVNWSLKRAKQQDLNGSYWVKWRKGDVQTWDGPHKDEWTAKVIKAKRERGFKLLAHGVPAPATKSDVTLAEAIAAFVLERTASQDASSVRRWTRTFAGLISLCVSIFLTN